MPLSSTALDFDEQLVAELYRLGVRHLVRFSDEAPEQGMSPADLIAALAQHPQARFRAALILLFLRHPEFASEVLPVADHLDWAAAITLRLYYQAAVYLQRESEPQLRPYLENWRWLPDFFSQNYGLPAADSIRPGPASSTPALVTLGELHQRLSGWAYNWTGSYRHNISRFLKHLNTSLPLHE